MLRDRPETPQDDPTKLWMIPYADLMSNLVILFLALFVFSYATRSPEYDRALARIEKEIASQKRLTEKERQLQEMELAVRLKREMSRLRLDDFGLKVSSRRIELTLPSPVLFREGSDRLDPAAEELLSSLAGLFSQLPNPILVEGHTDDVPVLGGRLRSNWELSAARAFSVVEFLSSRGLPAARFHARGYGEFRPVASNADARGRRMNRRIEISVIRELSKEGA
ncbi:MAG: flagellar motor protein MotB [Elusimicrobiota bacterium]